MAESVLPSGAADSGSSFTFHALENAFPSLQSTQMKDRMLKWNLEPTMVAKAFRFDHKSFTWTHKKSGRVIKGK